MKLEMLIVLHVHTLNAYNIEIVASVDEDN